MGDNVSLRGRQLQRFFVKHVRYGGMNPWNFTTDDIYYMIVFCPLSRAMMFEHYDDPDWINNYQDMINVRTKWRSAVRSKHGALPRDFQEQIFRKDRHSLSGPSPTPVIEKDMSVYFQPETPLEKESLYLPPPSHALPNHGGEGYPMPSPPEVAHLAPLRHQPQEEPHNEDHLMLQAPEMAHLAPAYPRLPQLGGEGGIPHPRLYLPNAQEPGFLRRVGRGLQRVLNNVGKIVIGVEELTIEACEGGWKPGEFKYLNPPLPRFNEHGMPAELDEHWGPLPPDCPPPSPISKKHPHPESPDEVEGRPAKRRRIVRRKR